MAEIHQKGKIKMAKQIKETIKELKKSRNFWRKRALQLEKYIENHCIDDSRAIQNFFEHI